MKEELCSESWSSRKQLCKLKQ